MVRTLDTDTRVAGIDSSPPVHRSVIQPFNGTIADYRTPHDVDLIERMTGQKWSIDLFIQAHQLTTHRIKDVFVGVEEQMNWTVGTIEGVRFDGIRLNFVPIQANVKSFVGHVFGLEAGVEQTELVIETDVQMCQIRELRPLELV